MSKTDLILDTLMVIKQDVGGIKQHLGELNSKVATNVDKIYQLEKDNVSNKIKWAKVTGITIAVTTAISLILKFMI